MADPNDPNITTTTKGPPAPGTPAGSAPEPIDPQTGQHGAYWVLTEEERAKGFVRPVRTTYVHRGVRPSAPTRSLTEYETKRYKTFGYVAFEPYGSGESPKTGRFWTEAQLNSGCGAKTTMSIDIAETYARSPKFYGATFCLGCKAHLPVGEFVWDGTDELVGS